MSDKENIKSIIDDNDKADKSQNEPSEKTDKKPLSDEVKQRIAGLAVIGVITVGLCITGLVGKFSGDSIPTASVSSSVSSLADEESSAADSSSVNSVDESSQEDESFDVDESADTTADESSEQETQDGQSDETSAESEKPKTEDTTKAESSQIETDPPQTDPPQTDPPQTDPPQTDPPQTDPPQTDPPKTDPPKTDPPKTDPPAQSGGLSANCSVTNSWEEDGKKCFQIGITINNGTSSDTSGWTVSITVPSGTEIINSWNGNFSVNGDTITITNVDYNGVIAAGGQSSDVGLIVKSPSEFTPSASVK